MNMYNTVCACVVCACHGERRCWMKSALACDCDRDKVYVKDDGSYCHNTEMPCVEQSHCVTVHDDSLCSRRRTVWTASRCRCLRYEPVATQPSRATPHKSNIKHLPQKHRNSSLKVSQRLRLSDACWDLTDSSGAFVLLTNASRRPWQTTTQTRPCLLINHQFLRRVASTRA